MAASQTPTPARKRPGVRLENFYQSYSNKSIEGLDGPLCVQIYLQSLIRTNKNDIQSIVELPEGQDLDVWLYEHLRQFCLELNLLLAELDGECTPITCPEMRSREWQYLCAAHPSAQSCIAIDYMYHTLDGACALLNSNKYFPSRISISPGSTNNFTSICRRLYRLFSHTYNHHRDVFDNFENSTSLYARFLIFVREYQLVPEELITIE